MTLDEIKERLMRARPFEGSVEERNATEVYEHGLFAPGVPVYGSLEEALADWRADYDASIHDEAEWLLSELRQGRNLIRMFDEAAAIEAEAIASLHERRAAE